MLIRNWTIINVLFLRKFVAHKANTPERFHRRQVSFKLRARVAKPWKESACIIKTTSFRGYTAYYVGKQCIRKMKANVHPPQTTLGLHKVFWPFFFLQYIVQTNAKDVSFSQLFSIFRWGWSGLQRVKFQNICYPRCNFIVAQTIPIQSIEILSIFHFLIRFRFYSEPTLFEDCDFFHFLYHQMEKKKISLCLAA